jgi:hypothetical protein
MPFMPFYLGSAVLIGFILLKYLDRASDSARASVASVKLGEVFTSLIELGGASSCFIELYYASLFARTPSIYSRDIF